MRIVRVRGKNLTSLPEFDLGFDLEPLGSVGLYAITGPTGAGKSTILDAMCLALFDRTPRLSGQGGYEVGREDEESANRLRANDPRSMMRRGASDAAAEVEFIGANGRRYRASWTCRRAHGKALGKMQPAELSLEDVDSGHRVSGKKGEVLEAVRGRLGLTFDQFRRSVLLAQGDFAAFLKASTDDRSELLEAMTGTEIYSELSRAAFEREKTERKAKEDLESKRLTLQILSVDERRDLDARIVSEERALEAATASLKQAESARVWYETLRKRLAEEAEAAAALERARKNESDAEHLRQELRRVEGVQDLRGPVDASDQAGKRVAERLAALTRSQGATATARVEEERRGAESEVAGAAVKASRNQWDEAQAGLKEAHHLDTLIGVERGQVKDLEGQVRGARAAEKAARQALEECVSQIAGLGESKAQAEGWLERHRALQVQAEQWPRWRRELERFSLAIGQEAAVAKEVAAQTDVRDRSRRRHDDLALNVRRFTEIAAQKERACEEAQAAEAAHPRDEIQLQRQDLTTRLQVLAGLEGIASSAADASTAAQAARDEERQAMEAASGARLELEASTRELATVTPALEEARRALKAAHARLDLAPRRAELREGEPCPLCGATDHPFAHGETRGDAIVADLEGRVVALDARAKALLSQQSRSGTLEAQQAEAARTARGRAEEQAGKLAEWQRKWAEQGLLVAGDLPARPDAAEVPQCLKFVSERLRRRQDELTAMDTMGKKLAKAVVQATEEAARVRKELEAHRSQSEVEQKRLAEFEQALTLATSRLQEAGNRRTDAIQAVEPAFEGRSETWKECLAQRPDGFIQVCQSEVDGWTSNRRRVEESAAKLADLELLRAQAQTQTDLKAENAARVAAELVEHQNSCAALQQKRAAWFGGRPVDEVSRDLKRAMAQADDDWAHAVKAHDSARQRLTKCLAEEAAAGTEHEEATREAERRRVDLAEQLGDRILDEVRGLLRHDKAWIEGRRASLQALTDQRKEAEIRLQERQDQRTLHESQGRPQLAEDAVREALETLEQERKSLQASRQEGLLQQRTDDQVRDQALQLDGEIARQMTTWKVWKSLSELIGSADGKAFRKFAQGLTLDVLVVHANRHLETLARRYRLMRVPGQDLDLQVVDLEMADEVRSINSLSGGESFLVSLALALGLASLSSERTRVDSLFIDEGFGSLDSDTLDEAMAALDALQADGRQVGVISHVSGLAERMGVQVRVLPQGTGRSLVEVASLR